MVNAKAVCLGQSCRGQGKPFSSSFLGIAVSENYLVLKFVNLGRVMSVWDKHRGVAVNQWEQPCSAAHQLALKMVTGHSQPTDRQGSKSCHPGQGLPGSKRCQCPLGVGDSEGRLEEERAEILLMRVWTQQQCQQTVQ